MQNRVAMGASRRSHCVARGWALRVVGARPAVAQVDAARSARAARATPTLGGLSCRVGRRVAGIGGRVHDRRGNFAEAGGARQTRRARTGVRAALEAHALGADVPVAVGGNALCVGRASDERAQTRFDQARRALRRTGIAADRGCVVGGLGIPLGRGRVVRRAFVLPSRVHRRPARAIGGASGASPDEGCCSKERTGGNGSADRWSVHAARVRSKQPPCRTYPCAMTR
jgi:hypothetical protein